MLNHPSEQVLLSRGGMLERTAHSVRTPRRPIFMVTGLFCPQAILLRYLPSCKHVGWCLSLFLSPASSLYHRCPACTRGPGHLDYFHKFTRLTPCYFSSGESSHHRYRGSWPTGLSPTLTLRHSLGLRYANQSLRPDETRLCRFISPCCRRPSHLLVVPS